MGTTLDGSNARHVNQLNKSETWNDAIVEIIRNFSTEDIFSSFCRLHNNRELFSFVSGGFISKQEFHCAIAITVSLHCADMFACITPWFDSMHLPLLFNPAVVKEDLCHRGIFTCQQQHLSRLYGLLIC